MTDWNYDMDAAPTDKPILVAASKWAGEIGGIEILSDGDVFITKGGPTRADYPGHNWWAAGGDYYATWVWPYAWKLCDVAPPHPTERTER